MPPKLKKKKPPARPPLSDTAQFEQLLQRVKKQGKYVLRLYVTGSTPRSASAIANIRSLCEEHLKGRYDLEVVDIYQHPSAASGGQIIAAPTLVKEFPAPVRRMVGDLGDRDRVLVGLDLVSRSSGDNEVETRWAKV